MKTKPNIIKRLQVVMRYIFKNELIGLAEHCEKCGSIDIESTNPLRTICRDTVIYTTSYSCKKCGSTADISEVWQLK